MGAFNIVDQLSFYGSYHHNTINKLIHLVFVPTILWSALTIVRFTGPTWGVLLETPYFTLITSISTPVAALYGLYYITLDKFAWFTYSFILFGMLVAAEHFILAFGDKTVLVAAGLHVTSWVMQFIGHGVFEGRAPTLLDSTHQALVLAPLFVWLEILFALGYKPDLHQKTEKRTMERISEWKKASKKQ